MSQVYGGKFLREPVGPSTLIFVHGLASTSEACWRDSQGAYWPDLVQQDQRLQNFGVYVFDYKTDFDSAGYTIGDVTALLRQNAKEDGLFEQKFLVFVAHSMGGIVARNLIFAEQLALVNRKIRVGLFLLASPAMGSRYADWFRAIAGSNNAQINSLTTGLQNIWLKELDDNFRNIKESNEKTRLDIAGKELIEDHAPILPASFLSLSRIFGPVVPSASAGLPKPVEDPGFRSQLNCETPRS